MHDEPQTLFALGILGQNLFVDPANRMVIAKLSSQAERIDPRAVGLTHLALGEIRRCLMRPAR
jgi:CubicO group peptidase (beta-lactamase class C family)